MPSNRIINHSIGFARWRGEIVNGKDYLDLVLPSGETIKLRAAIYFGAPSKALITALERGMSARDAFLEMLVPLQTTLIFFCSRRRLAFRLCLLRQRIYARIASPSALWFS